ncbi:2-hydroxyacid dehydrogenase [Cyclobacterium qasimii]|uniref:D-3-phosphoglycerate dehydrogenase n=2 Tax=Cyclobacterium qasimii TaxID=1350429 RepID=S7VHF7_9BACT|nr:C-terminal binding protein [Cyclobacterium qasimii]EPR69640.1 D-3-phosphoglycerate dehydrogenase [Cyclobacterium qasimii M12-11B]GEO21472.1 2-hydroxyacid dehydrogenase [Cyclobacterium qasimii]
MKIVRTDMELELPMVDQVLRDQGHELVLLPETVSEETLCVALEKCDVLLMCYTTIGAKVINATKQLKAIIKYGVGIDAIDIQAANKKGIVVVNIPEYAEETVAEGAFAMLLALAKKMPAIQNTMKNSSWAWPTQHWMSQDIAGKTLGIIGCGRIGTSMARMAGMGFRAKVIGYDPYKSQEVLLNNGIVKIDALDTLLEQSDFISLHAVLNKETHHIIGKEELKLLRKSAILINSARGALIDELALLECLEKGQIAGAGLDVFSNEPLNQKNHPLKMLYKMDNVILFPHLTFYTEEAMFRLENETLERCEEIIGQRPVLIKSKDPRLQHQKSLNTLFVK